MLEFLDKTFYGNSMKAWAVALAVALLSFIILSVLKIIFRNKMTALASRTKTDLDDFIAETVLRTRGFFLLAISIFIASRFIIISSSAREIIQKLFIVVSLLQVAIWGNGLIECWKDRSRRLKKDMDASSLTTYAAIGFVLRLVLWSIVILLALDNLGVNVTALVTGLGIGGVAVALALQNILGDLFASVSILLDKPFVVGDFIILDNLMGSVEHIGLKTTRVRSLMGEQLIFSNADLIKSRIKNYGRMQERRVIFSIGVTYDTQPEKLALIPEIIREIIEGQAQTRFDRSHFKSFGDFALLFETSYFIASPDFNTFMNIQQAVNLTLVRRFKEEGIEFAYPTQTIVLRPNEPAR
jgi:small-conductance mechanosensitive channel